jgi:hypothetical protein
VVLVSVGVYTPLMIVLIFSKNRNHTLEINPVTGSRNAVREEGI